MRDKNGRWVAGQSANPSGRPKVVGDLRDLAREHTEAALATLVAIMGDETAPPAARTAAACALLDRAYGRPAQSVEARLAVTGVADTAAEVLMRLTAAAKAAKAAAMVDVTPSALPKD